MQTAQQLILRQIDIWEETQKYWQEVGDRRLLRAKADMELSFMEINRKMGIQHRNLIVDKWMTGRIVVH